MSNMLEQAIVDATALKEAAVKNAEATILEKYSQEIKGAVDSLLDQEEDLLQEAPPGEVIADMSLAATHEEEPDDEVVTVNLEQLQQEFMKEMQQEGELDAEEMVSHEDVAEDLDSQEQLDETKEENESEEEFDIDQNELAEIFEEMEVDITPVKSGWLETPTAEVARAEEQAAALEANEDEEEDEEKKELEESFKKLQTKHTSLSKENKKFKSIILQMKDTINEVNTQNAKLLYVNQTLNGTSLNERQKQKIVEAIEKAGTVEEAKVIYETLQSAVGSAVPSTKKPQSLSEAVIKRSSTLLSAKQEVIPASNPLVERMQALAGIKQKD